MTYFKHLILQKKLKICFPLKKGVIARLSAFLSMPIKYGENMERWRIFGGDWRNENNRLKGGLIVWQVDNKFRSFTRLTFHRYFSPMCLHQLAGNR